MAKLKIEYRPTSRLVPYAKNARTHSPAQVEQIANSIRSFGFNNPVLIDENDGIVAGHGRVMAAQELGLDEVPCIRLGHLSDRERRAYIIADNQIALKSGWDVGLLSEELNSLAELELDLGTLGFDEQELDALLKLEADLLPDGFGGKTVEVAGHTRTFQPAMFVGEEDVAPEPAPAPVSRLGDVWSLGNHRLICGDATDEKALFDLLGNGQADLVVTDPPWNVGYNNYKLNKQLIHERQASASFTDPPWNVDYASKSEAVNGKGRGILNDKMSDEDWQAFVGSFCAALSNGLKNGAPIYVVMSGQEWPVIDGALRGSGFHWSATIVWVKQTFVISRRDYHSRYEPIWYGWKEGAARLKPLEKRNQDDVWEFPRPMKSELHPMMKPVDLVCKAILNSSEEGDVVLDLFGGSGTTLIACEKTARCARVMELDERYVDVIVKRWQDYTGKKAYHYHTNQPFDEIEKQRAAESV